MTTQATNSLEEFATSTIRSGFQNTGAAVDYSYAAPSVTFFKHVHDVQVPAQRDGFVDADDFLGENESDPEFREALAVARRQVADKMREVRASPLAQLRLRAGLSQRQLAEIMGTSQPYIARIEGTGGDLVLSTLERLSTALRVSIVDVIAALQALRRP